MSQVCLTCTDGRVEQQILPRFFCRAFKSIVFLAGDLSPVHQRGGQGSTENGLWSQGEWGRVLTAPLNKPCGWGECTPLFPRVQEDLTELTARGPDKASRTCCGTGLSRVLGHHEHLVNGR